MSWFGARTTLSECPRWDEQCQMVHWVDIDGGALHQARLVDGSWQATHCNLATPLAGAVLVADVEEERWILAIGGELVEWTAHGERGASRAVELPTRTDRVRLNEVVTDPRGRMWVGSMAYDWETGAGSFFRVDADGSVHRVVEGVTIANGVGWSPDGATMYSTDTAASAITAWRYDVGTGAISRPRLFAATDPEDGRPDGLAVDLGGNVWSAIAGGSRVSCFDPSGREIERIRIPAPVPTSCCFAGPDRDRLLVTTARKRLTPEALREFPDSGRVWDAGRIGVRGLPQPRARVRLGGASDAARALHEERLLRERRRGY